MKPNYSFIIILMMVTSMLFSCRDDSADEETEGDTTSYVDWSETTHSNSVSPDYTIVFNQTEVLRFDITISSAYWESMQTDLASLMGTEGGGGGPRFDQADTESEVRTSTATHNVSVEFPDSNPVWVPCSFYFDGIQWYNVGIRYKGNSSLMSAYHEGNGKLSFKLDFDEFEDDYPILKNQRFYGFKQLNLNNNFEDTSLMREKVASDLFREFGLLPLLTNPIVFKPAKLETLLHETGFAAVELVEEKAEVWFENPEQVWAFNLDMGPFPVMLRQQLSAEQQKELAERFKIMLKDILTERGIQCIFHPLYALAQREDYWRHFT